MSLVDGLPIVDRGLWKSAFLDWVITRHWKIVVDFQPPDSMYSTDSSGRTMRSLIDRLTYKVSG